MKRKRLFKNMGNIVKFGIFGTILTFVIYSALAYLAIDLLDIEWVTDMDDESKTRKPTLIEIVFLCSLLCSSDIIAAVTIVNEDEQPKLFSIVLREGLFNDAVSIVLFETMREFANDPEKAKDFELWPIIVNFLKLLSLSILVGLIAGFVYSFLTK